MAGEAAVGLTLDQLRTFVGQLLAEDVGSGDVTTVSTIAADTKLHAILVPRHDVVLAGLSLAEAIFAQVDPELVVDLLAGDGDRLPAGRPIMRVVGRARSILAAERSALNAIQHLTGIATLTRRYADALCGTECTLLDTRKTVPGLRQIEKYAARMGGAQNHRMRLDDGILIKDNHIAAVGSIAAAVRAAKAANTGLQVQVEVDTLDQITPALSAGAERLLCDNMPPHVLRQAVALVAGRVPIEASGGITLETIREIAATGVDSVSVGRITQSAPAADIGLDYQEMQVARSNSGPGGTPTIPHPLPGTD